MKDIVTLIDSGFRAAFLPLWLKSRLRAESIETCVRILMKENYSIDEVLNATAHMGLSLRFFPLFSLFVSKFFLFGILFFVFVQFPEFVARSEAFVQCKEQSIDVGSYSQYSKDRFALSIW